jgi:hypothetical protein
LLQEPVEPAQHREGVVDLQPLQEEQQLLLRDLPVVVLPLPGKQDQQQEVVELVVELPLPVVQQEETVLSHVPEEQSVSLQAFPLET